MFKEGKPDGRGIREDRTVLVFGRFRHGSQGRKGGKSRPMMELRWNVGFGMDWLSIKNAKIPKKINNLILEPNLSKELGALKLVI
jgi:hypothetical protein